MSTMKTSLDALARTQLQAAAASSAGRSAHTLYGGHEHMLRQTLIAMTEGNGLDEHNSPGEATLLVLRGPVQLRTRRDAWEGREGDLLTIPAEPHSLEATEDSAVLLTVAKPRW